MDSLRVRRRDAFKRCALCWIACVDGLIRHCSSYMCKQYRQLDKKSFPLLIKSVQVYNVTENKCSLSKRARLATAELSLNRL
jgi:hypothetical protein